MRADPAAAFERTVSQDPLAGARGCAEQKSAAFSAEKKMDRVGHLAAEDKEKLETISTLLALPRRVKGERTWLGY